MSTRRWRAGGLAVGLAALVAAGCGGHGETAVDAAPATPRPVKVTVAPVEVRPVERTVDLVGTLRGWDEVTVGTKRAGRVVKVLHDIGDRVEPGAPLVELETIDSELAVRQAEQQLRAELAKLGLSSMPTGNFNVDAVPSVQQARVTLETARRDLNRLRTLSMRNAATIQELQDAEDAERSALASYENASVAARATLANAQTLQIALLVAQQALEDTIIRAPRPPDRPDGSAGPMVYAVTARSVSPGQMLAAGEAVMSLTVEDPLKLEGRVPERYVAEVAVGQTVDVRVAAYAEDFEGQLTRINPAVDPVSRTFTIEALIPNDHGKLRPGSFAKASIITRRDDDATTVPIEAVVSFAGVTKVFVIAGDRAREVQVTTGLEDPEGDWIEVRGPLEPGALVATSGMSQLAEGTLIEVREAVPGEAVVEPALTPEAVEAAEDRP